MSSRDDYCGLSDGKCLAEMAGVPRRSSRLSSPLYAGVCGPWQCYSHTGQDALHVATVEAAENSVLSLLKKYSTATVFLTSWVMLHVQVSQTRRLSAVGAICCPSSCPPHHLLGVILVFCCYPSQFRVGFAPYFCCFYNEDSSSLAVSCTK